MEYLSNMKCADCHQDILQAHPEMCPYCRSKNLVSDKKFNEFAEIHPQNEIKKLGKVNSISMECPYCGTCQPLVSKSNEVACCSCKKIFVIPKKVLELL